MTQGKNTLVYDQHNWIYAYGDLDRFEEVLKGRGFTEGVELLPSPHFHSYNSEYDDDFEELMTKNAWIRKPLRDEDEY